MSSKGSKLRIFTWHIHGTYLYYLSQGNYELYIPVNAVGSEGYYGRGATFPFGPNVIEVPAEEVKYTDFDIVLFQSERNYAIDQYEILSAQQRRLPRIYLEHDPPRGHPSETKHIVDDPGVTLVHVTHFNHLMWNNNGVPSLVIEHGVKVPSVRYTGELDRGLVVINNISSRGRRLGWDIFQEVSKQIPLDLVGMGTEGIGLGEVLHPQLAAFSSRYRFFFNPIRFTSLGLAICEAMTIGIPVVGLATTELVTVIYNGINGFIHTDLRYLVGKMKLLLENRELAAAMGMQARDTACRKFSIDRFVAEWERLFASKAATRVNTASAMLQ